MKHLLALLCLAASAQATLITQADRLQIATEIGTPNASFYKIFESKAGDGQTGADFRKAAVGQGATVFFAQTYLALADANGGPQVYLTALMGGYNPDKWTMETGYTLSEQDWQRTAFLFVRSDTVPIPDWINYSDIYSDYFGSSFQIGRQHKSSDKKFIYDGLEDIDSGIYQTYQSPYLGPSFGLDALTVSSGLNYIFPPNTHPYNNGNTGYELFRPDGISDAFHIEGAEIHRLAVYRVTNDNLSKIPDTACTIGLSFLAFMALLFIRGSANRAATAD
ncbi:MAG: hypothetical protein SFV32_12825 [Opitutaceae bacterium]|nr:hypothetical protein [Opitutaceae bacterium]